MGDAVEGVRGVRAGAGSGQGAAVHAVERVQGQARRLQEYVSQGGGEPAPDPAVLAALAAGPIPVDQVQHVQALLAEARRLARPARPPAAAATLAAVAAERYRREA